MKSVLISIQPYWVFLIIAKKMGWNIGKVKTVEVRKNKPKDESWDRIAKIYCSKDKKSFSQIPKEYQPLMEQFLGKVIGEFVCDEIICANGDYLIYHTNRTCLTSTEIANYIGDKCGYFWHISDLVIYDKPRELGEFYTIKCTNKKVGCSQCYIKPNCIAYITRPFQSWGYVESEEKKKDEI